MSKNQILYRAFLWIFLFTLSSSIIFAYLQGRYPKNLDPNIAYSTLLGFISSAFLMIVFAYCKSQPKQILTIPPVTPTEKEVVIGEILHGNYSGTILEDLLPPGYGIIYRNAWQRPVFGILTYDGKTTTSIDFGNAIVIIGGANNTTEILEPKGNIGIIVRFIDETKVSFGY